MSESATSNVEDGQRQAKTVFNILSRLKQEPESPKHDGENDPNSIEEPDDIVILRKDPKTQQQYINKTAYLKLHRSLSPNRSSSVDVIREKFDTLESIKKKYSPAGLGYLAREPVAKPRRSRLVRSQIITAPTTDKRKEKSRHSLNIDKYSNKKDLNSNDLYRDNISTESEEYLTIVTNTRKDSIESILKFQQELDAFTMDKKKRTNSFRKLFTGKFFSNKDKKKKDVKNNGNITYNDNVENESNNFIRQTSYRHPSNTNQVNESRLQRSDSSIQTLERDYAQMHINQFNKIKHNFNQNENHPVNSYVSMDKPIFKSTDTSSYMHMPSVRKYIDTSSSASTLESDRYNLYQNEAFAKANQNNEDKNSLMSSRIRDTPPRALETRQDVRLVNPKALIPITSERALANPYQSSSGVSSEEKLHGSNEQRLLEETYGTVLDSLETRQRNRNMPPPRSPSLEPSKLKLPQNREIVPLSPRMRSSIPPDSMSTEKLIATELLRARKSSNLNQELNESVIVDSPDNVRKSEDRLDFKPSVNPLKSDDSISRSSPIIPDRATTSRLNSPVNRTPTPLSPARSSGSNVRSTTPLNVGIPDSPKTTPQKEDIRKSVEAYYWKEIKKLKDQENYELYLYQMQYANGYADDPVNVRRSRSLSPSVQRTGRRSVSLPRESRTSGYVYRPNAIPVASNNLNPIHLQQNFARNTPERRTVDGSSRNYSSGSLYRPIFKRGSLSTPPSQQHFADEQLKRKVSFSNSGDHNVQSWPTKNGFVKSPPQRRVEKLVSEGDDEVFLPDGPHYRYPTIARQHIPNEEMYYNTRQIREPLYAPRNLNRVVEEGTYGQRYVPTQRQYNEGLYGQPVDAIRTPQGLTRHGSIQINEGIYGQRFPRQTPIEPSYVSSQGVVRKPIPLRRQIIVNDEIFGQFGGYVAQNNPNYPSRQSIVDYNNRVREEYYQQKQVSVTNKVCDVYGQIHDVDQRSGVIMGQLTPSASVGQSYTQLPKRDQFVRNGRLTASANDMYRRVETGTYGRIENVPTRPLPPLPRENKNKLGRVSDTENGSDVHEMRKVSDGKAKTKKRGIFSK